MALVASNNFDSDTFLRLCLSRSHGLSTADLAKEGWADMAVIMKAANPILRDGRIQLTQLSQNDFLFQATDPRYVQKLRGLDSQHMMVFQQIQSAGDKGAWSKTLQTESGLQAHAITRITKLLLQRQLIKEVKSVQGKNRKVFMAYDVVPSKEVSGGTWYQEGMMATQWIEQLRSRCLELIEMNPRKILQLPEIHQYVAQQPGRSVPTEEEVAQIMKTLVLDEKVHSVLTVDGLTVYKLRGRPEVPEFDVFAGRLPQALTRRERELPNPCTVPCMQCHLRHDCRPGGRINPERCEYITTWLAGADNAEEMDVDDPDLNDW